MTRLDFGALCFGLVIGWITYRTLRSQGRLDRTFRYCHGDCCRRWSSREICHVTVQNGTDTNLRRF